MKIVKHSSYTPDFSPMPPFLIQEMVERVEWMSPIDYEILIFFEEHDITVSPKVLAVNIDYDRQYTSKRCRRLVEAGILEQASEGLYSLSNEGRSFLHGDVDASELEDR